MRMLYLCKCIQAVKIVRSGRCTNFLPPMRISVNYQLSIINYKSAKPDLRGIHRGWSDNRAWLSN